MKLHFEVGWSDSDLNHCCFHKRRTLKAAAKCAKPLGLYGYVFAVEDGMGRKLKEMEKVALRIIRIGEAPKISTENFQKEGKLFASEGAHL